MPLFHYSFVSSTTASYCLSDIAEKLGDVKNGSAASETLTNIAEVTSLDYVYCQVMDFAFIQKSPKVLQEAFNWLSTAIKEFGISYEIKIKIIYSH